jgi:hypothetical protein
MTDSGNLGETTLEERGIPVFARNAMIACVLPCLRRMTPICCRRFWSMRWS